MSENQIECGHICCPTPTSEADSHFHREEPFDCAECNRITMAAGAPESVKNPFAAVDPRPPFVPLEGCVCGVAAPYREELIHRPECPFAAYTSTWPDGNKLADEDAEAAWNARRRKLITQARFEERTRFFGAMSERERLAYRFEYHPPTPDQIPRYERIRAAAKDFALLIDDLCPISQQRAESLLLLQNAVMMANAAIACNE